jgi:hypothetical protein
MFEDSPFVWEVIYIWALFFQLYLYLITERRLDRIMKHEWRKKERDIYVGDLTPRIINIPTYNYFSISGQGSPDSVNFKFSIEALYSLAYAVRMMPKWTKTPAGYFEYTVYPLEGFWSLTDTGVAKLPTGLDKDELIYILMLRQPSFVTQEVVEAAFRRVRMNSPSPLLESVKFGPFTEGRCIQMLHVGPFSEEQKTFDKITKYMDTHGLTKRTYMHKEIYLSDFRRTEPHNLKTTLRYLIND